MRDLTTSVATSAGAPPLCRYRVTVAYDGTRFAGWQRQPDAPSVQAVIESALTPLAAPWPCTVHGSGRTDAGVHARGQVAHFDLPRTIAPLRLRCALNGSLPPDVRVLEAAAAAPAFDARRSARGKEYRYFIWNAEVLPPERRLYAAHAPSPLDVPAMRTAARRFVGIHDFAAFSANPHRAVDDTVRRIASLEIDTQGPEIALRVRGDGFLYKMVRSIAGFLLAVGSGKETPEAVDAVLAARIRTARVATAPPQGLFLWQVWYADEEAPSGGSGESQ